MLIQEEERKREFYRVRSAHLFLLSHKFICHRLKIYVADIIGYLLLWN